VSIKIKEGKEAKGGVKGSQLSAEGENRHRTFNKKVGRRKRKKGKGMKRALQQKGVLHPSSEDLRR